jgi:hypothetical protein
MSNQEERASIDPQTLDPAFDREMSDRREALKSAGQLGAALASAPLACGLFAQDAAAQDGSLPDAVIDALNFALRLEYLERNFYQMGLESGIIPDGEETEIFQLIRDHEAAHVQVIINDAVGDQAAPEPEFDFTAGGNFAPFDNYQQFLALSQGFEDTGVRAYKGQAGAFAGNASLANLLGTALQIHSVEARHAARIRRLRGNHGWIPGDGNQTDLGALAPVYDGEGNTTQGGLDLADELDSSSEPVTEAFDEPLGMDAVLNIATMFISDLDGGDDDSDS